MNAIAKETQTTRSFDQLKTCLKTKSMTEDCDFFSQYLKKDGEGRSLKLGVTPGIRLGCGGVCDLLLRGWRDSFESMTRSLAESRAETVRCYEKLRQKELNEEKLHSLITRTRLNVLVSQISPHFLFNALNTIGVLIEENPKEARCLTIKMANIFRQTLRASEREMVSLHEELSFIQDYLEIEKIRFGKRLRVEQTVSVNDAEIPCFTLQLLIENAIKHGAAPKVGTTTIRILAIQERNRVRIQVSDDGMGMPKEALDHILERGYGLRILIDRLRILYASDFSWHVESEFQKGTVVSLQLPLFLSGRAEKPVTKQYQRVA